MSNSSQSKKKSFNPRKNTNHEQNETKDRIDEQNETKDRIDHHAGIDGLNETGSRINHHTSDDEPDKQNVHVNKSNSNTLSLRNKVKKAKTPFNENSVSDVEEPQQLEKEQDKPANTNTNSTDARSMASVRAKLISPDSLKKLRQHLGDSPDIAVDVDDAELAGAADKALEALDMEIRDAMDLSTTKDGRFKGFLETYSQYEENLEAARSKFDGGHLLVVSNAGLAVFADTGALTLVDIRREPVVILKTSSKSQGDIKNKLNNTSTVNLKRADQKGLQEELGNFGGDILRDTVLDESALEVYQDFKTYAALILMDEFVVA